MKIIKAATLFILMFSFFLSAQVYQETPPWAKGQSEGKDLQIYLVEFSPGDHINDYFGHIAMVVKDTVRHVARVYNFGLFSIDEDFITHFAMGRLIFSKAALSLSGSMRYYISSNRSITFHELDLTDKARADLAVQLAWEVLPQNSQYLYHHYNDNCATRLRDLIDRAVYGQFKVFASRPARFTLRGHTLRYTAHDPLMQWLLMFLMNNSIDQPILEWQEMFLPAELVRYAKRLSYRDSLQTTHSLISNSAIYYDSERPAVPETADNWPLWTIICGLLIPVITVVLALLRAKPAFIWRIFLLFQALITFVFGFAGTGLFFMALFTDHVVTYYNENLLLANPLTFLIFFLSAYSVFRISPKVLQKIRWLWYLLAFSTIVLLLLKIFPVFDQDNLMIMTLLVPVNFTFAFTFYKKDFFGS